MKGLVVLAVLLWVGAARADQTTLQTLHYDLLLADHCGLMTDQALRGYKKGASAARSDLSEAQSAAALSAAGLAFGYEYQNRGLGGSRPWCRDEGMAGLARLIVLAN